MPYRPKALLDKAQDPWFNTPASWDDLLNSRSTLELDLYDRAVKLVEALSTGSEPSGSSFTAIVAQFEIMVYSRAFPVTQSCP